MNPVSAVDSSPRLLEALRAALAEPLPANAQAAQTGPATLSGGAAGAGAPRAGDGAALPTDRAGLAAGATAADVSQAPSTTLRSLALNPSAAHGAARAGLQEAASAAPPPAVGASADSTPNGALPTQLHAEPAATPLRPADTVATPALVTPLFTGVTEGLQPRRLAEEQRASDLRRRGRDDAPSPGSEGGEQDDCEDRDDQALDGEAEAPTLADFDQADPNADAPLPLAQPDAGALAAWQRRLARAGQHEALRELALRRRVLVVELTPSPAALAAPAERRAEAVLLAAQPQPLVRRFAARWWPGTPLTGPDPSPAPACRAWRLHRPDGLAPGWRTRGPDTGAAPACELRMGVAGPVLLDAATARLEVADRQRFTRALGRQWSLLLLVIDTETEGRGDQPGREAA